MSKKLSLLVTILIVITLGLIIRGRHGNLSAEQMGEASWTDNGPLELSPERGRFALTYSLLEDKSFSFSLPVAKLALPDLGYKNGKYVSLFAPGISYLVIPGYLLGKWLGISQVGSYAVITLFAFLNFLLIKRISQNLGANSVSSVLAGITFLFATPAAAYAGSLYQHHVSTFLVLTSIWLLQRKSDLKSLALVWFLCGAAIPIDYPNLILMLPVGILALTRLISLTSLKNRVSVVIRPVGILTFLGVLPPLLFFLWFNKMSYGNPFQFSGTVSSVNAIDSNGLPTAPNLVALKRDISSYLNPERQKKSAIGFFKTRNILNGLYIHLISPDRGLIRFTPVILFGLLGIFILSHRQHPYLAPLLGVLLANITLYSMWGDPWGGWAFGSRYLIPGYAILAIFAAQTLTLWRRNILFLAVFLFLFIYSTSVNILGAITTSKNPPQVEVLALEQLSGRQERYSFDRNWEYVQNSAAKSFIYQTWARQLLSSVQYYYLVLSLPVIAGIICLITAYRHDRT